MIRNGYRGDTDQWTPALFEGTKAIEPYMGKPDYILDVDLADRAIDWIRLDTIAMELKVIWEMSAKGKGAWDNEKSLFCNTCLDVAVW